MTGTGTRRCRRRARLTRGVVATEYILVCGLLVLTIAFAVPAAIDLFKNAYQIIAAVVCSPFPAGM